MHNDYLDPDRAGLNDEHPDNETVKQAFSDYESLADLYRSVYKYTDCGPSMGALVSFVETVESEIGDHPHEVERTKWFYCDDLRKLGTFKDMDSQGVLIRALCVSSIVEGIDACTDTLEVTCLPDDLADLANDSEEEPHSVLSRIFWAAVESVNQQADDLWKETHGCESCAKHFGVELDYEHSPVWSDCPDCGGSGEVI
jgi:hypothetical protein